MNIFLSIVFVFLGVTSWHLVELNQKQQATIKQLTERVLLLENALSDKSGIKPEKTK